MRTLTVFEEVTGTVVAVEETHIIFENIGPVAINDTRFLEKVEGYVSKKISVLRTNIPGKEYLMMCI